jgi:hypothetical protein
MRSGSGYGSVRQLGMRNDKLNGRSIAPSFGLIAWFAIALLAVPCVALAQLNTQHVKGSAGLKAGSQGPPGGYVVAPMLYFYTADEVRTKDGDLLPLDASLNAAMFGAGYAHVTTKRLLGGFYGFQVIFPVGANNRIQGTEIDQTRVPV